MKFLLIQMLLLLVLTPINSEAKMYKCIDEKGKVSFTDKMCPSDSSKEEIQTKNKRAHSQPINKDGITILDWTNRRSGSGVYLSLDYHVLWAWQTKAVPIFFELILVCK